LYQLLRSWNPVLNAVYVLCLLRNAVYLLCLLRIDFPGIASKAIISLPDMLAMLELPAYLEHPREPCPSISAARAVWLVGWLVG